MPTIAVKQSFSEKLNSILPNGTGALFVIQIFSTIGFSVLYSTLILYATKGLKMEDTLATSLTGSFIALNYFLHLLGGYIGGRYISYRSLFALGMFSQIIGCLFISQPAVNSLIWGLAFFLAGAGLNVTCINCMVMQLFEPDDKRRESAFLWNYSGMNLGFFLGFSISGYFHNQHAYQTLFLLSALGNILALALVGLNWTKLKDRDTQLMDSTADKKSKLRLIGISMVVALILANRVALEHSDFSNQLMMIIGVGMFILITALAFKQHETLSRNRMLAYVILAVSSIIFWALYQLAPMGLNLFIERNVDRHFLGMLIAPQWIQNINTIVIIIGGPLLSVVFTRLRERGLNINIPLQFSFALFLIGLAYVILPLGIQLADVNGYTAFSWILASYLLQSLGELFISPIGYAMVGQLAPVKLRGLMMGIWMMITGIAAIFSDYFSKLALGTSGMTDPLTTNASYSETFNLLGWSSIAAAVVLLLLTSFIAKLTKERAQKHVIVNMEDELKKAEPNYGELS